MEFPQTADLVQPRLPYEARRGQRCSKWNVNIVPYIIIENLDKELENEKLVRRLLESENQPAKFERLRARNVTLLQFR